MSDTGESSSARDESGVTMVDVLQDQEELEEDANAVLGAGDENNCTYNDGYVKRQALYACLSCTLPTSPDFLPAGICLACSYHCHEGHELVELYTKRNFKCDCGTKRSCCDCKLQPAKSENTQNRYNQNFSGLYCICARPYPDPEDSTPDEMIQCCVCEDWYHGRHLELQQGPPDDDSYAEMICVNCVRKLPFLIAYAFNKDSETVEVEAIDEGCKIKSAMKDLVKRSFAHQEPSEKSASTVPTIVTVSEKPNEETEQESSPRIKSEEEKEGNQPEKSAEEIHPDKSAKENPLKKSAEESLPEKPAKTLFLREGWRSQLCGCPVCNAMYTKMEVNFLRDDTDTVHHYESQGQKRKGQFEQGMEALSQMDRIKQVEAISMYADMKTDLMEYLGNFARQGKVVKEEDIRNFFQMKKSAKRMKLDLPPPDSCK